MCRVQINRRLYFFSPREPRERGKKTKLAGKAKRHRATKQKSTPRRCRHAAALGGTQRPEDDVAVLDATRAKAVEVAQKKNAAQPPAPHGQNAARAAGRGVDPARAPEATRNGTQRRHHRGRRRHAQRRGMAAMATMAAVAATARPQDEAAAATDDAAALAAASGASESASGASERASTASECDGAGSDGGGNGPGAPTPAEPLAGAVWAPAASTRP